MHKRLVELVGYKMIGLKISQSQGWQLTMSDFAMYDFKQLYDTLYRV